MIEDEVNLIKHKLPFLYKRDRASFEENVSLLIHLIKTKRINPYNAIDIVYTLIVLCTSKEWKKIVNDVYYTFGTKLQIELFKLLVIDVQQEEEKDIIEKFKKLLSSCETDEEIMKVCFIVSSDFIKPTLLSKMKTLTVVPPSVTRVMGNEAFKRLRSPINKMKCLQKLIDVTPLAKEQLEYLLETLEEPEFTNIILDIFLRSENWEYITLAEERLNFGQKRYFEVDNNVHYFDFINLDKIPTFNSESLIKTISDLLDIGREVYFEIDKIYDFIVFVLNCSHSYNNKTLKDIFCYVWSKAAEANSQVELVKLIYNDFVSICARGFATNLLFYLRELGDETDYVIMNDLFIKKDEVLKVLRTKYPGDDDIWLDKEQLTREIQALFPDDILINDTIKLIVS